MITMQYKVLYVEIQRNFLKTLKPTINITKIENLSHIRNLTHLDLSSNTISVIEGLQSLTFLKVLNLSCNKIKAVQGLESLWSLVSINLSYNEIVDISGFVLLDGTKYHLEQVQLQGNKITNKNNIFHAFHRCFNLKFLSLSQDGASNPVCSMKGYREYVLESLPKIDVLDGMDRYGNVTTPYMADVHQIPGLGEYLQYLNGVSSSSSATETNPVAVATPFIDAALNRFRIQAVMTETSSGEGISPPNTADQLEQAKRIEKLEKQLSDIIAKRKSTSSSDEPAKKPLTKAKRVNRKFCSKGSDSDGDSSDVHHQSRAAASKVTPRKTRTSSNESRNKKRTPRRLSHSPGGQRVTTGEGPITAISKDLEKRKDVESTYHFLLEEMNKEREKRWKAEEALKKMSEYVRDLQNKARSADNVQSTAGQAISNIRQQLIEQRESYQTLQTENTQLRESLLDIQQNYEGERKTSKDHRNAIKDLEKIVDKLEKDQADQASYKAKVTQESQMKAAAATREVELLRTQMKSQKQQLHQLQELLATREQEHKKELSRHFSLDSREIQDLIQKEVNNAEKSYKDDLNRHQDKITTLTKQYAELEDEFRMALRIEADRFSQLQESYEDISSNAANHKQALMAAKLKDDKSSKMISELSSLVKEQKARISELSLSKQEQVSHLKERAETLEVHLNEARRRMVQMEILKQEKAKLQSQVQGQESVIEGLRSERKLWGQELAQQGASLAQDRGILDAKIVTLTGEISILKKQLTNETDSVKIKTKLLEDQTDTIKKLKEAILERDRDISMLREENIKQQKLLEQQLMEEKAAYHDSQKMIEDLTVRKEELKQKVVDLEDELQQLQDDRNILTTRWKEKSALIGQMEKQVTQLKSNWDNKEKTLTEEKDKALQAANLALEKIRNMDNAFRGQLDRKEEYHRQEILNVVEEKQREIDKANTRVSEVEVEMRTLLLENQENKKVLEERVSKMGKALTELQQGFI